MVLWQVLTEGYDIPTEVRSSLSDLHNFRHSRLQNEKDWAITLGVDHEFCLTDLLGCIVQTEMYGAESQGLLRQLDLKNTSVFKSYLSLKPDAFFAFWG